MPPKKAAAKTNKVLLALALVVYSLAIAKLAGVYTVASLIPKEMFINIFVTTIAIYAFQFLVVPTMLMEQHFEMKVNAMHLFLARGSAAAMFAAMYAVLHLPMTQAYPLSMIWCMSLFGMYPLNAALVSKLPAKYPMHYMPEALSLIIPTLGALTI